MLMMAERLLLKLSRPPKSGVPATAGIPQFPSCDGCEAKYEPRCKQTLLEWVPAIAGTAM